MSNGKLYKIIDGVLVEVKQNDQSENIIDELEKLYVDKRRRGKILDRRFIVIISTLFLVLMCFLLFFNILNSNDYFYKICYLYFGISFFSIFQVLIILVRDY